jgi:hypothetical protein
VQESLRGPKWGVTMMPMLKPIKERHFWLGWGLMWIIVFFAMFVIVNLLRGC